LVRGGRRLHHINGQHGGFLRTSAHFLSAHASWRRHRLALQHAFTPHPGDWPDSSERFVVRYRQATRVFLAQQFKRALCWSRLVRSVSSADVFNFSPFPSVFSAFSSSFSYVKSQKADGISLSRVLFALHVWPATPSVIAPDDFDRCFSVPKSWILRSVSNPLRRSNCVAHFLSTVARCILSSFESLQ